MAICQKGLHAAVQLATAHMAEGDHNISVHTLAALPDWAELTVTQSTQTEPADLLPPVVEAGHSTSLDTMPTLQDPQCQTDPLAEVGDGSGLVHTFHTLDVQVDSDSESSDQGMTQSPPSSH